MEAVERLTEAHIRELADKVGISFMSLEGDMRGVFIKIQKRWLTSMTREAKGGKLQKRVTRPSEGKEGGRNELQEEGRIILVSL